MIVEKETLPDGLEPSTLRLTAARSNQLSYGRPILSLIHSLIKSLFSLHKQTNKHITDINEYVELSLFRSSTVFSSQLQPTQSLQNSQGKN